jgi:hypothetical protein
MLSYAGIGSRDITEKETELIMKVADKLSKNFVCYSGNAEGADIAFQHGSNRNCVIFLPWRGFNSDKYDFHNALAVFDVGKSAAGMESVAKYHPNPNLKYGAKMLMARNYHQVMGYEKYPPASFIVCCADEIDGEVQGGTGQACRIAQDLVIPRINIRVKGWNEKLSKTVKYLLEKK